MGFYKAKFAGKCGLTDCELGGEISVGMDIAWNPKVRPTVYYHFACMEEFKASRAEQKAAERTERKEVIPEEKSEARNDEGATAPTLAANGNGLAKMAALLSPYIKVQAEPDAEKFEALIGKHTDELMAGLHLWKEGVEQKLSETAGMVPRRIEVVRENGEAKKIDSVHEKFEALLHLVNKKDHVYLWGPPGSGKSTAANQVADALGLEWGYISLNPQTPDSRILGFIDAGGTYRPTVFRRQYEQGGVMCIDELDNSSPSLCVTINSGLEGGQMAFPDGMVARHKDFVLVATGNTTGRGGNAMFPERRPFDAAFQERFTYLEWDYDQKLEMAIALSVNPKAKPWVEWIKNVRAFCRKNHPRVIVSPRASFKGAKYIFDTVFSVEEIAEMVIWKGNDSDTVKSILSAWPLPTEILDDLTLRIRAARHPRLPWGAK